MIAVRALVPVDGEKTRRSAHVLGQVRVDALPAHGFVRENGGIRIMAVSPGAKLPRPLLGISFLQVGNGNRLHGLVGNLQHPLFKAQPARLRLRLKCSFFFRWQMECDRHNCRPYAFRLAQSLHARGAGGRRFWGHDERANVSRGANPGTVTEFPANRAGNSRLSRVCGVSRPTSPKTVNHPAGGFR
jgi:hypothetical protein